MVTKSVNAGWRLLAALEAIVIVALVVSMLGGSPEAPDSRDRPATSTAERPGAARLSEEEGNANGDTDTESVTRDSPAQQSPAAEADADLGVVLHGRVTDPSGAPVEASVRLTDPARVLTYARCDENGVYAKSGLAPGHYACRVYEEGYENLDLEFEIPPGQPLVRRDFVLPRSQMIKVRIETPGGREFYAAMEEAGHEALARAVAVVATSTPRSGRFPTGELHRLDFTEQSTWGRRGDSHHVPRDLDERYSGAFTLKIPSPAHAHLVFRDLILETRTVEPGQHEMDFVLDVSEILAQVGRVRAQIVEAETGAPLPGVRVSLRTAQGGGRSATTGKDGTAEVTVAPGLLEFRARAPDRGLARHHRWIRVEPNHTLDLGRIALTAEVTISGRVLGPDGQPVVGARIDGKMMNTEEFLAEPPSFSATTESGGKFEYRGYLGRGRALIIASKDGLARIARVVDTGGGSVENLVLQLPQGQEVVVHAPSASDRVYRLWLHDEEGRLLGHAGSSRWPMDVVLASGTYQFTATLGLEPVHVEHFTVGNEPKRLEIELP